MADAKNHQFKYRADVDGLRAIAILPVIFFHAGLGFGGGYVGVDVFFVISGYLISGLILKDLHAEQFHITEFWERRVRRIMPALAVVVLACLAAAWFEFFPQDFKEFAQSVMAQALLVANFFFYNDAGYFAQGVDMKPLLHTWSLAVEEQFYLLFPFILMGFRKLSRKSFLEAIILIGVASFVLSVYCSYKHPRANFYLLPSRAWELLIGSFLAAIPAQKNPRRWLNESVGFGGLTAILIAVFCYDNETRFPGASAILPCFGAGMIIWSNCQSLTVVGKFLASKAMVFIGLISYSLYLWHWPVLVFFKYRTLVPLSTGNGILLLLASFALAVLSWRFVETPFRKKVIFKTRPQILAFGGVATLLLLLAGFGIFKLQGVPSRIPAAALNYLEDTTVVGAGGSPGADRELSLPDVLKGDFNELGKGDKTRPIHLMVWGDSHAKVIMPVLNALCLEHSSRGVVATHPQTAPFKGYDSQGEWSLKNDSIPYNDAVINFIRQQHIPEVLIIARWDYYLEKDKGAGKVRGCLEDTLSELEKCGAKVWILRQVPKYPWPVPKALASAVLRGRDPESIGLSREEYRAELETQEPIFEGLAAKFPGVTILDPTDLFADASGRCRVASGGRALYYDSDHVNVAGSMMLRPLFEPLFSGVGAGQTLSGIPVSEGK